MATRFLIVYGSTYGQTAKISKRLEQLFVRAGAEITTCRGDQLPAALRVDDYDAIVVGTSLIRGQYQKYIEQFVLEHRREPQRYGEQYAPHAAVSGA
jgi:menaquinone-dependent protoporphyrinogen oxidase